MTSRPLDVISLGRSCADLYGEQVGTRLEDVQTFAKYVGGCAANIAVGTSRLGLKSALISRVGDEQLGRFVIETLNSEGVDTSQISVDPERLTALVFLGIRDQETFPHIFYRENCADMALEAEHINADFIASAKVLVVTGTHFSKPGVDAASRKAIRHAKQAGTRVVFDIDYRPVLWGLAGHANGEGRFVESGSVTEHLQSILSDCDLVVGTEEEIHIAGGSTDTMTAVRAIRERSAATIVVKRGPLGCVVFPTSIPASIDDGISGRHFKVEVMNTLGAGDGFMSGFLRGWVKDEPLERCCEIANATGALVVSRHGCAPAMPTWDEINAFFERTRTDVSLGEDPALIHLHQATTRSGDWPEVHALAFDHRSQFENLADQAGSSRKRISIFKGLIAKAAKQTVNGAAAKGIIVDDRYGSDVLFQYGGDGTWVARPVEVPGSVPLEFEADPNLGLAMRSWPKGHVAKCLVFYHPDDPEDLRQMQESKLRELYEACLLTGHELLLEIIPHSDSVVDQSTIARTMSNIYDREIYPDWWKIAPPDNRAAWDEISSVVNERDPHCRGIVLLGLNAGEETLSRGFAAANGHDLCKGFAVGRSIFQKPAEAWFAGTIDDDEAIRILSDNYRRIINLWNSRNVSG